MAKANARALGMALGRWCRANKGDMTETPVRAVFIPILSRLLCLLVMVAAKLFHFAASALDGYNDSWKYGWRKLW